MNSIQGVHDLFEIICYLTIVSLLLVIFFSSKFCNTAQQLYIIKKF